MEQTIQLLIYIHAGFGGLALVAGFISILAKKGQLVHKKAGLLFYYAMLISGILAMIIALLPNHQSPFLFAIGIFSSYFVLTGYRALRFKRKNPPLKLDKWIAWIMIATGVFMIFLPIILAGTINIVLTVFALVGISLSTRDLLLFQKPEKLRKVWLKLHIGKMMGAYIAATTAFVVVNQFFPGVFAWFTPGIIGGIIMAYWNKKARTRESHSK